MNNSANAKNSHNSRAPYWALALFILCITGLTSTWINIGTFWNGYVLDMTGPAWNYILFRVLFTYKIDNIWTRFFTPQKTLIIFLLTCFTIEGAQFFNLYKSTFDPWDFLAYVSILIPLYLLDSHLSK